jgi:hypothetical protein
MDHERAHLYDPENDTETLVVVGFHIDGYKRLDIRSVRVDQRVGLGPEIIDMLDESQLDDLHGELVGKLQWYPEREWKRREWAAERRGETI